MRISDLRFAHNDDTELFQDQRSILETAVELLSGKTSCERIQHIEVCRHEERWYCRTGNRRLASYRLAQLAAPHRFSTIPVAVKEVDHAFLTGGLRRPKLTTDRNGVGCAGQWLVIKETGETVGQLPSLEHDSEGYGADLLWLLAECDELQGREESEESSRGPTKRRKRRRNATSRTNR